MRLIDAQLFKGNFVKRPDALSGIFYGWLISKDVLKYIYIYIYIFMWFLVEDVNAVKHVEDVVVFLSFMLPESSAGGRRRTMLHRCAWFHFWAEGRDSDWTTSALVATGLGDQSRCKGAGTRTRHQTTHIRQRAPAVCLLFVAYVSPCQANRTVPRTHRGHLWKDVKTSIVNNIFTQRYYIWLLWSQI